MVRVATMWVVVVVFGAHCQSLHEISPNARALRPKLSLLKSGRKKFENPAVAWRE